MNKLNELMESEHDAMVALNAPMADSYEKAMDIIRDKLSGKEFIRIEEMLVDSYNHAEDFGFEQGFMRGIAVAKGGAA